jgi:hypothetical protein
VKQVFIAIMVLIGLIANAQDTTKVLFIGNSFTSQNNLPLLFTQLAQGAGNKVVVASHMPGGMSVGDISQGTSAHMNNPLVYALIRSNDWDYIVLQDNQGRFCLGYGQFPASSLVIEGHLKIRDSLLYYHPCAHMIWYAGFGPKNGYPLYGNSGIALIDSIYRNYQFLRDTAHQIIAPIGPAFEKIILSYPSVNLWGSDDTHSSLNGSYLIANIIYSTIFKSSPISSSYNPGLSHNVDSLLKNTGYQTVYDSVNHTGLSTITPQINQIGNSLYVSGFQDCDWYFNNNPYLTNNCTPAINQSGQYFAIVSDNNGCNFRTFSEDYYLTGLDETSTDRNAQITIYPNPATITLKMEGISSKGIATIYNFSGKLIFTQQLPSRQIDISNLEKGLYFIKLTTAEGSVVKKVVIRE